LGSCVCWVKENSLAESSGLMTGELSKHLPTFCQEPVSFIHTFAKISLSLISGDVIIKVNSVYIAGFTQQQIKDLVQESSFLM